MPGPAEKPSMRPMNSESADHDRVCIVGAGPAGLATGRALKLAGIEFDIVEKHSAVGGIWDPDNPGSPMYESAHFISSKTMSGHYGFPMPDSYPDYPSHRQILEYIRSFSAAFGLDKHVEFNTTVESARHDNGRWTLQTDKGTRGSYRWLVCANGVTWIPKVPEFPGAEDFTGTIMHSVGYRSAESLRGKRVLVVGAGNSGVDIACDAASSADSAFISLRRGYHFLPKHILGKPLDVFGEQSKWMPLRIQQFTTALLLRALQGDLSKLGLQKPDHKILESHPIVNTQLIHYLQHGDIAAKCDIERFEDDKVIFRDGSREEVDLVVLATGYEHRIPYVEKGMIDYEDGHPVAFMRVFHRERPELFINGFIETNGGAYRFFDHMARMIAMGIKAQIENGTDWKRLQGILAGPEPNLTRGINYVNSGRHTSYVNAEAWFRAAEKLRRKMGWCKMEDSMFEGIRESSTASGK